MLWKSGAVDVYFAPRPPEGQEANWVLTREGELFFVMFRKLRPAKGSRGWELDAQRYSKPELGHLPVMSGVGL